LGPAGNLSSLETDEAPRRSLGERLSVTASFATVTLDQGKIGDMGTRRWDQPRRRLVPVDPPSDEGREEWPFYCATFHLGVRWYVEHQSDERFGFLRSRLLNTRRSRMA
jgi:hypothetical protein